MPLLIVLLGVALLIFMIIKLKLNTFVSLVVTAFLIALMLQIPIAKIPTSGLRTNSNFYTRKCISPRQ